MDLPDLKCTPPDVQASGGREVVGDSFFSGNGISASHMVRSSRDCTNPSLRSHASSHSLLLRRQPPAAVPLQPLASSSSRDYISLSHASCAKHAAPQPPGEEEKELGRAGGRSSSGRKWLQDATASRRRFLVVCCDGSRRSDLQAPDGLPARMWPVLTDALRSEPEIAATLRKVELPRFRSSRRR